MESKISCLNYLLSREKPVENHIICHFSCFPCVQSFLQEENRVNKPRRNEICLARTKHNSVCGEKDVDIYNERTNLAAQFVGMGYLNADRLSARCAQHRDSEGIFDKEISLMRAAIAQRLLIHLSSEVRDILSHAHYLEMRNRPLLQGRSKDMVQKEYLTRVIGQSSMIGLPKELVNIISQYTQHHTWLVYEKCYSLTRYRAELGTAYERWLAFMFIQDHTGKKHLVDHRQCWLPVETFIGLGHKRKHSLPLHEIYWKSPDSLREQRDAIDNHVDSEFHTLSLADYQAKITLSNKDHPYSNDAYVAVWVAADDI